MKTIILKTKQFSVNEKQLIGLLYTCPLGEPFPNCVFSKARESIKSDYLKIIDGFKNDKISELFFKHKRCLINRVRINDIESTIMNYQNLHKEIAYLLWTNKGKLDFLTAELIKLKWIKSQNNFAKLFNNKDLNLRVYWNAQYKYELAYLLFKLKEGGYFRTVNSKGYFRIAERHIIDYSEKTFKNNSLKQISSKISLEPNKYINIINIVNNVIYSMCHKSNRLL